MRAPNPEPTIIGGGGGDVNRQGTVTGVAFWTPVAVPDPARKQ